MIITDFVLAGSVPSKKNSRQVFARGSRVINIPSKRYKEWHDYAMQQLKVLQIPALKPPYAIKAVFCMKDNRKADLDNKLASLLDLLQDAGIIEDDCWQDLKGFKVVAGGINKTAPWANVQIWSEIEETIDISDVLML